MHRFVATIVTLSFLFALGATGGFALSTDGYAKTVIQAPRAQLAPTLTAEVPLIEKESELDPVLVASFVIDTVARSPKPISLRCSRDSRADACANVLRYLAARRIQI